MARFFISVLVTLFTLQLHAQNQLHIYKAKGPIVLDAKMDDPDWQDAEIATNFHQYFPFDSSLAVFQTEVRVTYDEEFLYVFAVMHSQEDRSYVTPSLRRDYRGEANDAFVVQLDTYQDKTNCFSFGVNPYGVQREGLVSNGGVQSTDLSLDWDNKWYSEARMLPDRWECELAIPFKTIRYKSGLSSWNINFYRIDSHMPERSTWAFVPRNIRLLTLAYTNQLIWDKPLHKTGSNISLIPYAAYSLSKNYEKNTSTNNEPSIGGDAKIGLTSALNLDLTINPNFAQVEVDQQVTNLDRFEIFFPEKRQFFLENADLFSSFGSTNAQPFFSRRIGVTRDSSTGQNINNPIYGGFRLSGKLNNNWRIGLLSMQAAKDENLELSSINYSVAAVQRKIFKRSNIAAIVINKQAFQDSIGGDFNARPSNANTVVGLDYNLASNDGRWSGKYYYHHSFNHEESKEDSAFSAGARLDFTSPKVEFTLISRFIGNNFNPEVGFVRRRRYNQIAPQLYYWMYPKSRVINKHGPGTDFDFAWNDLYGFTDWDANLWYQAIFQNGSNAFIRLRREYVFLFQDFDPTGSSGIPLLKGTSYTNNLIVYNFQSNARRRFFFNVNGRVGGYFNGVRQSAIGSASLRIQPRVILSADISYNRIRLPKPYSNADLILIAPRFDFTFSRNVFWTTYVQYNSQINNWNINSRFQWRFKPVSDLFIVYTDNYASTSYWNDDGIFITKGQPKLRSLSIKISYWLNP